MLGQRDVPDASGILAIDPEPDPDRDGRSYGDAQIARSIARPASLCVPDLDCRAGFAHPADFARPDG